jgi:Ca2+/Na+ antiporter
MTFIIWLLVVMAAIIVVLLIRKYSSVEFVAHAKLLFKAWSVWLASGGSMLSAWVQSFPQSALDAWSSLPGDVKGMLPPNYLGFLGAFMVVMGVLAQFVRQSRLLEQRQQMESKT